MGVFSSSHFFSIDFPLLLKQTPNKNRTTENILSVWVSYIFQTKVGKLSFSRNKLPWEWGHWIRQSGILKWAEDEVYTSFFCVQIKSRWKLQPNVPFVAYIFKKPSPLPYTQVEDLQSLRLLITTIKGWISKRNFKSAMCSLSAFISYKEHVTVKKCQFYKLKYICNALICVFSLSVFDTF